MSTYGKPQYYIYEGVRRSVAMREAGKADIMVQLVESGKPDVFMRVPLDQLHSPKAQILRDSRYVRHSEYPIAVLRVEPIIIVQPLGEAGQLPTTPLLQVKLI